jgi:hypothetical protein
LVLSGLSGTNAETRRARGVVQILYQWFSIEYANIFRVRLYGTCGLTFHQKSLIGLDSRTNQAYKHSPIDPRVQNPDAALSSARPVIGLFLV